MPERYSSQIEVPEVLEHAPELVTVHPGVAQVTFLENNERKEQKIGYTVTKPIDLVGLIKRVVIMTSQWSEYADRAPQRDRTTALTASSGVVTIALDTPGQSPNSGQLTRGQRKAIRQGDWSPVADVLWEAAWLAAADNDFKLEETEVTIIGPSQGGATASIMAAHKPPKQVVSDVILFNSASIENVDNRSWPQLMADFLKSGTDLGYYASLNPEWTYQEKPTDMLRIVRRLRGHIPLPIQGMAATNDAKTLFKPLREGVLDARITIVHSELDIVSKGYNNRAAKDYLERTRADVRIEELEGEYHGILNHLGSLVVAADKAINATN